MTRRNKHQPSRRDILKPCPTKYKYPYWQGKHNIVGVYVRGKCVGRRCVSCGASESTT